MQELNLWPSAVNNMCSIVIILLEPIFDAFDWPYHLTNVSSCGTGKLSDMIHQSLQLIIEVIGCFHCLEELSSSIFNSLICQPFLFEGLVSLL